MVRFYTKGRGGLLFKMYSFQTKLRYRNICIWTFIIVILLFVLYCLQVIHKYAI